MPLQKLDVFDGIKLWLASYAIACTPANIHAKIMQWPSTCCTLPFSSLIGCRAGTVQDLWYGQSQLGAEIAYAS